MNGRNWIVSLVLAVGLCLNGLLPAVLAESAESVVSKAETTAVISTPEKKEAAEETPEKTIDAPMEEPEPEEPAAPEEPEEGAEGPAQEEPAAPEGEPEEPSQEETTAPKEEPEVSDSTEEAAVDGMNALYGNAPKAQAEELKITVHPKDVTCAVDATVTFTIQASGSGLSYKWQYCENNTYDWITSTATGLTTSYSFTAYAKRNGRKVRCIVTDDSGNSVTSLAAKLTIQDSGPVITTQPQDVTSIPNVMTGFSIGASGNNLSYKWQYSDNNGASWVTRSTSSSSFSFIASVENNGRLARCVVTDEAGKSVTSKTVRLTVTGAGPVITAQPQDATCAANATAKFTVQALGSGLSYKWQYSDDNGTSWSTTTAAGLTTSYSFTATAARNGRLVRCIVTDNSGKSATSDSARLQVEGAGPVITAQPKDVSCALNETATFAIKASGSGLSYTWQYSDNGGASWSTTKSASLTTSYSFTATAARNGRMIRCVVTDSSGRSTTSNSARLTMPKVGPVIISQPQDVTALQNETATFAVRATGSELRYQWQYSDDNGASWKLWDWYDNTCVIAAAASYHGWLVHCVVTDENGNSVTSRSARLQLKGKGPMFIKQPQEIRVAENTTAKFSVAVLNSAGATYKWQYSDDHGITWNTASAAGLTTSYSFTANAARNGRQVRCIVTDANGVSNTSKTARLQVDDVGPILENMRDVYCNANATAKFSVRIVSTNQYVDNGLKYDYTWQFSDDDGASWKTASDAGLSRDYSFTATPARNGRMVRCIVTAPNGRSTTSQSARLYIQNSEPIIITQPKNVTCAANATATFTVLARGYHPSYIWQYSDDGGITWTAATAKNLTTTYAFTATKARNGRMIRCVVRDQYYKTVTSNAVRLTVSDAGPMITVHPKDAVCTSNQTVKFTVKAEGSGLSYKWQYSDDNGASWATSTAAGQATYSFIATKERHGRMVRCVVTNSSGNSTTSKTAYVCVDDATLTITAQPKDVTCAANATATFRVTARGYHNRYSWQYSDDNGATWNYSTAANQTSTYSFTATAARHGRLVRCFVSDDNYVGYITTPARLTVQGQAPLIVTQPKDTTWFEYAYVYFKVEAVGIGLKYKWQYSDDNGASWNTDTSAGSTATYEFLVMKEHNGRMVRCVVTDSSGKSVTSRAARLLLEDGGPVITAQPKDVICVTNGTAKFSVAATNGSGLSYKWQYSDNGGASWSTSTAAGLTTAYSFSATADRNGRLVRCVVTDSSGKSATSKSAKLTVHNHSWATAQQTVSVPEQGHYKSQTVVVKQAYDEQVWVVDKEAWEEKVNRVACSQCGDIFVNPYQWSMSQHHSPLSGCWSYSSVTLTVQHPEEGHYKTVHHDAVTETRQVWVVDTPAHTETVTVKKCKVCGEIQ